MEKLNLTQQKTCIHQSKQMYGNTNYYIHLTAFFQDNLGKPAPER